MKLPYRKVRKFRSSFTSFPHELGAFPFLLVFCHSRGEQWSQGCLWAPRIRYAFDVRKKTFTPEDLDWFERRIGPFLPSCDDLGIPPITGRLGCTCEGAGKRRLFAIGNYVNQRLLKPVHQWFASVLRRVPMDGTFNQTAPLIRLVPSKTCFSYDLKSATDRWPLVFMFETMALLFDRSFASSVVNSTLLTNVFEVPFVKRALSQVSFVTGQPLGYSGSWPLFAFTHHVLVWWAAEQVRPGILFERYALLGDDILITDPLVAEQYRLGLQRLGVKISTHKSLISSTGAAEFAKQFLVKDMRVNLSPVSMKALCGFHHPYGLLAIHEK